MRVTIVPHGELCSVWPRGIELEADTVREAVSGYQRVCALKAPAPNGRWLVRVEGYDSPQSLVSPLTTNELHVYPVFDGAGGGGGGSFFKIVIGVVLIATAVALGPTSWAVAGFGAGIIGPTTAGIVAGLGSSLILGGVMEMISPAPKLNTGGPIEQSEGSQYLGQPKNTAKVGTRIPIAVGRVKIYGHILSFDAEADPRGVGDEPPNSAQRRRVGTYRVGYA